MCTSGDGSVFEWPLLVFSPTALNFSKPPRTIAQPTNSLSCSGLVQPSGGGNTAALRASPQMVCKKPLDGVVRMQHIMSMKTAAVHSRIQPEIKEQAEGILQRLGLSPTEAIRMFYTQITLRNGLPFDVAIPNDVTIKALEESRNGRNLERFDSTEKLFDGWSA